MTPITDLTHLDRLINRHMQAIELRRRLAEQGDEIARRELAQLPEGPYVTVSRQLGTGGRDLARRLAERLGWQLFDKEILLAIAEHTNTREKIISRLDEKAIGMFDDLLARWFSVDSVGPSDFVREMMQVIWALARNGQAVLVGRGANWLLDPRYGLRVRIVAPLQMRTLSLAQRDGIYTAAAEQRIREDDAAKAAFMRQWYRRDIDDPLGYDLILNLAAMDADTTLETMAAALSRKLEAAVRK